MIMEELTYKGHKCVRLERNGIEAVVTSDVGPRVLRFGFVGGANHFYENEEQLKKKGKDWNCFGGHRLWHAPEDSVRTYERDNNPVTVTREGDTVSFLTPLDPVAQTQKRVDIEMTDTGLKITHTVTNCGLWEIELAAWGITVMDVNGLEVIPQNRKDTGLLGNRSIGLWPYTKIADKRLHLGDKYITVSGDPAAAGPLKIGTQNESGFAGYFNHGELFVKTFDFEEGMTYPDFNDNFETYTCPTFTEVETLTPLEVIAKGECVQGSEEWFLFRNVPRPAADDEETIDRILAEHGFTAV